jgi:hypothetical protein
MRNKRTVGIKDSVIAVYLYRKTEAGIMKTSADEAVTRKAG